MKGSLTSRRNMWTILIGMDNKELSSGEEADTLNTNENIKKKNNSVKWKKPKIIMVYFLV